MLPAQAKREPSVVEGPRHLGWVAPSEVAFQCGVPIDLVNEEGNSLGKAEHDLVYRFPQTPQSIIRSAAKILFGLFSLSIVICLLLLLHSGIHLHYQEIVPREPKLEPIPSDFSKVNLDQQWLHQELSVTVVLINWDRPLYVRDIILPVLVTHPKISEIIVSQGRPDTAIQFDHEKVKLVDDSDRELNMGLSIRFYHCLEAKNAWVIHMDDDMLPTLQAIDELLMTFSRNTNRIVGKFGRHLTLNQFYLARPCAGLCPVVLTKFMVMERKTCSSFFDYAPQIQSVVEHSQPFWNGEDIFMALVSDHIHGGAKNLALPGLDVSEITGPSKESPSRGDRSVSGNIKGFRPWSLDWLSSLRKTAAHYAYRTEMWVQARDMLRERPLQVSHTSIQLKICVYTVAFGGYDFHVPKVGMFKDKNVDYFVLTDTISFDETTSYIPDPWTIMVLPKVKNSSRANARHYKISSGPLWNICNVTIYMDGNLALMESPGKIVASLDMSADMGMVQHPFCETWECEYEWICLIYRQDCEKYRFQERLYTNKGFSKRVPSFETSFIIRRHNDAVKTFNTYWEKELFSYGHLRDQMSVTPVLYFSEAEIFSPENSINPLNASKLVVQVYPGHNKNFNKWQCHAKVMGQASSGFRSRLYCFLYYITKRWVPIEKLSETALRIKFALALDTYFGVFSVMAVWLTFIGLYHFKAPWSLVFSELYGPKTFSLMICVSIILAVFVSYLVTPFWGISFGICFLAYSIVTFPLATFSHIRLPFFKNVKSMMLNILYSAFIMSIVGFLLVSYLFWSTVFGLSVAILTTIYSIVTLTFLVFLMAAWKWVSIQFLQPDICDKLPSDASTEEDRLIPKCPSLKNGDYPHVLGKQAIKFKYDLEP